MKSRDFYIDKDGFKLYAKLDMPDMSEERMPILILIHGLTGQMDEAQLEGVRDAANDNGLACLRVDMYGHGKSDGNFSNHNLLEWVSEVLYIIEYAKKMEFVTDIYLAGHSQGGLVAMLASAIKADIIKSLILISPAINIVKDCKSGTFFDARFDEYNIPATVHFWDEYDLNGDYIRVARSIDVDKAIDAYKGPVLVVHGTADDAVDVACGIEVADKYKSSTLKLIEGDSHCFDYHLDKMVQAVREYIDESINSD